MSSINSVTLMGNVCADVETKYTQNGLPVCTLRMATNEYYKGKDGSAQSRAEFHRVVVFGKSAEACGKVLAKGRLIVVQGRMQTRQWDDKTGVRHYTTEVVANRVQFLPSGGTKQVATQSTTATEETTGVVEEVPAETQQLHQGEVDWR